MQDLHRTGYVASLDPDTLLYEFRKNAGLTQPPGVTSSYGGWEADDGFVRGAFTGHYLTAASRMYAATGDSSYLPKVNYIVSTLAQCQQTLGGGYLSAFPSTWFDTLESGGQPSVPYYTIHKIMAGLVDAYQYTGNNQALTIAESMSDYFAGRIAKLTPAQIDTMLHTDLNQQREFGSMNGVLTDLYVQAKARGDANPDRFLTLANTFNRPWFVDPLANGVDILNGLHANCHIAQAVGMADYANVTGDQHVGQAAENFWNFAVRQHSFDLGGNSFGEYFSAPNAETGTNGALLSVGTAETCNANNMLKLTNLLFQRDPKTMYAAYYENALYNDILASIDPNSGMMTYYMSLKPGHFKTYSTPSGGMWCCMGTGIENTTRFNDAIYYHKDSNLWINQYIPSQVEWNEKGITLRQEGNILTTNNILFTVNAAAATQANLNIRVPSWASGPVAVSINGQPYQGQVDRGAYLSLDRQWQNGDQIAVSVPKKVYIRRSMDDPTMVSVYYGPFLLAGRLGTSGMPTSDQSADMWAYANYSDPTVPSINVASADPTQWLQLVDSNTMTFQVVGGGGATGILFTPFYEVNHERYSTYWKLNTSAATRTWCGGGEFNDWLDPTNWDVAPGTSDSLQFSGNLTTTANNNYADNIQFNGVTFTSDAGAFTLTGNAFTLAGNIVNNSSNLQTISTPVVLAPGARTVNTASADITLSGSISGAGSLVKTGAYKLTLSGSSVSVGGGTTVQQGTLCFNSASVFGDVTNQGTVIFNQVQNGTMSGKILGGGNMIKTGSGTLALVASSNYSGSTTIEQGTLRLQAVSVPTLAHRWSFNSNLIDSVGGSNATIVNMGSNHATLSSTQVTLAGGARETSDYISLGNNLLPNNSNPITFELWATQKSAKNWSRIFDFGSSDAENLFMSWTQDTNVNADRVEWVDSAGRTTADNTNAPYTLNQEYHIALVIQPGAGQGGNTHVTWYSAPSSAGTIGGMKGSFDTPNTLAQFNNSNNWLGRSQYTWDDTANASYNEVRIWQDALTDAELQTLQGWGPNHSLGPDAFGGHGQLPATTSLNISAGASFDMNGFDQTIGSLSGAAGSGVQLGSGTLTVGADNTSTTFSGAILGPGNIVKNGSGVLTLKGNLSSLGSISIAGGSLQIDSLSASVHSISGGELVVGDGSSAASVTADSIIAAKLTIAAEATVTISAIPGGPLSDSIKPVPEPSCIVMLMLTSLTLLTRFIYKRSKGFNLFL